MTLPTPLAVTALYAGLLGLVLVVLSALAGRARAKSGVSLGDGGKPEVLTAQRRQGNFIEYVPYILVLMAAIEMNGAPKSYLHAAGLILLVSRIVHPIGLSPTRMNSLGRMVGTSGTFLVLLALSIYAILQVVTRISFGP